VPLTTPLLADKIDPRTSTFARLFLRNLNLAARSASISTAFLFPPVYSCVSAWRGVPFDSWVGQRADDMAGLTDTKIRKLKKPGLYCDGAGLYLQVVPSTDGKKLIRSWIFRFHCTAEERAAGRGRERQMGLGELMYLGHQRRAWLKGVVDD